MKVRDLLADRAGHECSFPTCQRRTIGPGAGSQEVSGSGIAAHIYAASPNGPRGQSGLSVKELAGLENGIWLCSDHAKLVDNNRGRGYSPETLLSFKALQEGRVALEVQGLYSPLGWIHEVAIIKTPLFRPNQKIPFAKLNLIYGDNATGKTALTEWVAGFFDCTAMKRWMGTGDETGPLQVQLSMLNPKPHRIGLEVALDAVSYSVEGRSVAFVPIGLRIIRLSAIKYNIYEDDLTSLSKALSLPTHIVRNLAQEIQMFPHAKVSNIKFSPSDEGQVYLHCDVSGTAQNLGIGALSGREVERVYLEFATAAARLSGRYSPTLLILDGCPSIIFDSFFDFYSHHLLDPENQFQTILTIPTQKLDLDSLPWKGWQVIRTTGETPNVSISPTIRGHDNLGQ